MKTLLIVILSILPITCFAKHTISGRITDKNDNPIANARVRAYDYDALSPNDLMGETYTDGTGYYTINYTAKNNWDTRVPLSTSWRPNIFIKVSITVRGRCDDGEWNETANWEKIGESRVYSNHMQSDDLTINLKVNDYPKDNIEVATFTECENMVCSYNFFFHYHCMGCYMGKKTEWNGWGTKPYIVQRCIDLDNSSNCSQSDRDYMIRECNNRILDVLAPQSGALSLQENCIGATCNQLKYLAVEEKQSIFIVNNSGESVILSFTAKPFKNWKKFNITHYLSANDSLLIPSINYLRFKVKTYNIKEN